MDVLPLHSLASRFLQKEGFDGCSEWTARAFSRIYLVERDGRKLMAKVLKEGEEQRLMFENERTASERCGGIDGLVVPEQLIEREGLLCILSPFVEGFALGDFLRMHRVSTGDALLALARLSKALSEVERRGYVHGDVNDGNVMIDAGSKRVELLDCGLLTPVGKKTWENTDDYVLATMEYASPEQLMGETLTSASDVYSLGLLFHFLLARQLPFHALYVLILSIQTRRDIRDLLVGMLRFRPEDRIGIWSIAGEVEQIERRMARGKNRGRMMRGFWWLKDLLLK